MVLTATSKKTNGQWNVKLDFQATVVGSFQTFTKHVKMNSVKQIFGN